MLLLDEKEIDVNVQNVEGRTALMLAAEGKHTKIEEMLLNVHGIVVRYHPYPQPRRRRQLPNVYMPDFRLPPVQPPLIPEPVPPPVIGVPPEGEPLQPRRRRRFRLVRVPNFHLHPAPP